MSGNFIFDWNVRECQGILLPVREYFGIQMPFAQLFIYCNNKCIFVIGITDFIVFSDSGVLDGHG